MLICRSGGPKSAMELPSSTLASLPACVEDARHRLVNIAMIRYCGSGMIGLCGGDRDNKPSPIAAPQERTARLQSLAPPLFPVEYFPAIRKSRNQYFDRV